MRSRNCSKRARALIAALRKLALALPLLALLTAAPLSAREVDRQEVDEQFAADVPVERQLYCGDTQIFTMPNGAEVTACINWKAQSRTRLVRTYAILDGPETDVDRNLATARECFAMAVASQNDPYRTAFDGDRFLKATQEQFKYCASILGLQRTGQYEIKLKTTGVWVGGK